MQQNLTSKIHNYLPEVNVNEISFETDEQPYAKDLQQFTENIQIWSNTVLEKAQLPTAVNEAKALTTKYNLDTNVGCALQMVVELDAVTKSVENQDAATAALASMKLLEAVWRSSIFRNANDSGIHKVKDNTATKTTASISDTAVKKETENKINHYQNTINELKENYPHCNVNALRLLAATRLNVTKQELDDLNITPN